MLPSPPQLVEVSGFPPSTEPPLPPPILQAAEESEPKPPPPKKPIASPKGLATSKPLKSPHETASSSNGKPQKSPKNKLASPKAYAPTATAAGQTMATEIAAASVVVSANAPFAQPHVPGLTASAMPRAEALELPYDTDKSPLSCLDLSDSTTVSVHQSMEQSPGTAADQAAWDALSKPTTWPVRTALTPRSRDKAEPPSTEPPFGGGGGGMLNSTKEYDEIAPILSAATSSLDFSTTCSFMRAH